MITFLYIKLLLSAIAGQLLQIAFKAKSLSKSAGNTNIQYNLKWFLELDWKPIIKVLVGIAIFFLAFGEMANPKHLANGDAPFTIFKIFILPTYLVFNAFWILIAFVFGGFGSFIGFKFQSVATNRILGAQTSKALNSDEKDNTVGTPTPAEPVK